MTENAKKGIEINRERQQNRKKNCKKTEMAKNMKEKERKEIKLKKIN